MSEVSTGQYQRLGLRRTVGVALAGLSLAIPASACAGETTTPLPPCIEITPPEDVATTVETTLEAGIDYWADQDVHVDPDLVYYAQTDELCSTRLGHEIGGPAFLPQDEQIVMREHGRVRHLGDPVIAEVATLHELGHNAQMYTESRYRPESDEDARRARVLRELRADCLAGVTMQTLYPEDVPEGAQFLRSIGDEGHGSGEQRRTAFLLGANQDPMSGFTCDYLEIVEVTGAEPVGAA